MINRLIGAVRTVATVVVALAAVALSASAQTAADDGDDRSTRINPEVDYSAAADSGETAVVIPGYVKLAANRIALNGADWSGLCRRLAGADSSGVSIVHIGDSHLQADVATAIVRRMLQADYGDGGRGLVAPLKMAGTNEPRDYSLRGERPTAWTAAKLMKRPWAVAVGFTGVAVAPKGGKGRLTVATLSRTGTPQTFDRVRLLHNARPTAVSAVGIEAKAIAADTLSTAITLPSATDSLTISVALPAGGALYGMTLERTQPGGLLYHVIGNNGAAYVSYNALDGFGRGVALLRPDLIIVSLGANEAFSRMTADEMYTSVAVMVGELTKECPGVPILLTTPMECQKSTYTRRKGRRRSRTYAVNTRVAGMREAILRYGREQGVATYDFYDVAGGAGASARWVADGLMARDRIHCSTAGYGVQGQLLYEALTAAFANSNEIDRP